MASDVRFLKQRQPGNPSARKLMPQRFADGMEIHLADQTSEQRAQSFRIGDRSGVAVMSLDDPLLAVAHFDSQGMAPRHSSMDM